MNLTPSVSAVSSVSCFITMLTDNNEIFIELRLKPLAK